VAEVLSVVVVVLVVVVVVVRGGGAINLLKNHFPHAILSAARQW